MSEEQHVQTETREPVRRVTSEIDMTHASGEFSAAAQKAADLAEKSDTLVVVSKIKKLVRENGELNTSECAVDALTRKVIEECLKGIERAKSSGRKTLMGRDIL